MKTVFKIQHDDSSVSADRHALIEVARYGVSIVWFRKEPLSIDAVSTYNFPEDATTSVLVENLQTVIEDNNLRKAAGVMVFYNFKDAILVPAAFYHADTIAPQLDLVYGVSPDTVIAHDLMGSGGNEQETMYCVYRIPIAIHEVLDKRWPAKARHSSSVLSKLPGTNVLQCTIFHSAMKIVLYRDNQLQFVQQFGYKTPADVVYHLLNSCDKHDVNPAEVNLYIDGMIDSDSSLYQEIYKYFLNVQFNTIADDIVVAEGIKEHPLHFITHLTELARCV